MLNRNLLESIGTFSTTLKEGVYVEFSSNGHVKHVGLYKMGKLAGWAVDLKEQSGTLSYQFEYIPNGENGTKEEELDSWAEAEIRKIFDQANFVIRCSFCGKSTSEVLKIIAGPTCYICNECIGMCNDIIQEEKQLYS